MNMRIPILIASCLIIGAGCENTIMTPRVSEPEPAQSGDVSQLSVDPGASQEAPAEDAISTESPNDETMPNRENLSFPGVLPKEQTDMNVRIKTNKGEILIELLPDEGPNAASNFVYLITNRFYDGLTFHRVEPGFVIQGGDPEGTGRGGPGYRFEDDKVGLSYDRGIVAMANAGPNTNGSQFFIMLGNTPLPPNYSIFGRVLEGMDVVDQIVVGDVMESVTLEPKK